MITRAQMIWLGVLVLGDILLAVVSVWMSPESVPVHWNFRGEVDRYGSPWELALVFPVVVVIVAGLLVALPAMGSVGAALERSRTAYGRIAIAIVAMFIAIHANAVWLGPNRPLNVGPAITLCAGLLLAVVGNWMGKIRRNSLVGIRTPWTLKSDAVWERTHRIGGRLQVVHGLAVVVAAIFLPIWASLAVLLGGLFALLLWSFVYSWSIAREARSDSGGSPRHSDRIVKPE